MTPEQQKAYLQLAEIILARPGSAPYLVAINGKDASGKTVFSDNLASYLKSQTNREIIRISIDDFMNERAIRRTPASSEGEACYRYTINFDLFKQYALDPFLPSGSLTYKTKVFDFVSDSVALSEDKHASKDAIVVIDGVFLLKESLLDYWSLKVLLEINDETTIERGAKRDVERIGDYATARQRYVDRYVVSQAIYYSEAQPSRQADIVIDNNDYQSPKVIKTL